MDHYTLLATLEDGLALPRLGKAATARAGFEPTLADFFLTGSALDMNRFNAYTLLKCAARLHDAGAATTLTALERMLTRSEKARATRLVMISKTPRVLVETLIPRQSR